MLTNKNQIFSFLAFLPFFAAPFIAVEIPRALTYLPLFTILFALPLIKGFSKEDFYSFRYYLYAAIGFTIFVFVHTYLIAPYDAAYDRFYKLLMLFAGGSLLLIVARRLNAISFDKTLHWIFYLSAVASLLVFVEIIFDGTLYSFLRQNSDKSPYVVTVFNRSAVTITLFALTTFFLIEKKKIIHYLAIFSLLPMLFVTSSQSAQLVYVVAFLFYFIFPFSKKWAWVFIAIALSALTLIKPFAVPYLYNDMPAFLDQIDILRKACAGPRMEIWDYISRKIYDAPIIGHGLEFTKTYKDFDTQARYYVQTAVMHPHNYMLQLWIEFGLVGVLLSLAALNALIVFIYRRVSGDAQKTAFTMLLSFLLVSLVSHGMWQSWWVSLAFMLSALIIMSVNYKKR